MKRTIWITLVLLLMCVLVLSACDSGDTPPSNDVTSQTGSNNDGGNNEGDDPATACQHISSDWITDKEATCKEAGSKHKECTKCEEILETGSIDKLTTHTPVTDSRVEPTFTTTGLTEGSHCNVCGVVLVAQDTIPMIPSKTTLTSNELSLDGRNLNGSFSYATEIFNFANDITVTNNSPWVLSTDVFGMQTVATKIVPLNEGNNMFYIHVTNPDQTVSSYTVNIYRNHLYTVRFNANGGTSVSTQYVEEGYWAEEPATSRVGYTFVAWDYDFNTPITSNITISANWNANGDTPYKIEYYLQNLEDDNYSIISGETEELTGTTDTTATATEKSFLHFTYNQSMSIMTGNIDGEGSLVLKVYYTRDSYTISNGNTNYGCLSDGGTYKYGTLLEVQANENIGCKFVGWYHGETLVSTDNDYAFAIDMDIEARFNVKEEMENFIFTSTLTTCSITGLKDKSATELIVPDCVTSIGRRAFSDCDSLTSIIIPDSVTSIGKEVFYDCSGLTSVTIPDSVTSIGEGAFRYCSSLTSITIPDSVTSIGNCAFERCASLTSITLPFIGAKKNGTNNTHFGYIFGASIWADNEYFVPSSLKYVTITGGSSIGEWAFYDCLGLTSIIIPDSVTSIGKGAFYNCIRLTSIKYRGTRSQWNAISKDSNWNYKTGSYTITYNYTEN